MGRNKGKEAMFPRCVDRRHDCFWMMEDGTCALLNQENKKCTFYKTMLEVALAKEKRETLCRERGIVKYE